MSPACGMSTSSSIDAGVAQPRARRVERRRHLRIEQRRESSRAARRAAVPRSVRGAGGSRRRCPRSTSYRIAASSTDRHSGPTWSIVALSGTTPSSRDLAERRLQPDEPAGRRRNADRAAGVGADRGVGHAVEHRRGRAARRSARRSARIERMPHGAERRVLVGRAERELVQVGLADEDRARVAQPRPTIGASSRGDVSLAHARGRGRRRAARRRSGP